MKKKIWKPVATGVSMLLAGVIVSTAVMNSKIEAEAADTFLGIQNLITEVSQEYQATQEKYTILEVVPDRSASEIGYLFDGYEPALSVWDEDEMRWVNWKEQLAECIDAQAREKLVEELKVKLQDYYDANGINNGPVSYANDTYQESDTAQDGYELIKFEGSEKTGWFVPQNPKGPGYQLIFLTDAYVEDSGIAYYQVVDGSATLIDETNKADISPDTVIYKKQTSGDTEYYMYYGIWESVSQEEVEEPETPEDDTVLDDDASDDTSDDTTVLDDAIDDASNDISVDTPTPGGNAGDDASDDTSDDISVDTPTQDGDAGTDVQSVDEDGYTVASVTVTMPILLSGLNTNEDEDDSSEDITSEDTNSEDTTSDDTTSDDTTSEDTTSDDLTTNDITTGELTTNDTTTTVSEGDFTSTDILAEGDTPGEGEEGEDDEESSGIEAKGYYIVTFEKITDTSALAEGDRVYIVDDANITRSDNAEYTFHEATVEEGGQKYSLAQDSIYVKNAFTNNEWFRKYVLSMTEAEYGNFPVEVISYTPAELEAARANGTFPDFDFLFINSGKSAGWKYSATADEAAKAGGDITADVWNALYANVKNNLLPCLIDGNVIFVQEDADSNWATKNVSLENTNIFLLCTAFCQESLGATDYAAASATKESLWNGLAEGKEDGHFTTDHVYCHTGNSSIVNDKFSAFLIYQEGGYVPAGFQKVLDEIELENLYRESDASGGYTMLPTNISQALVVRHIMNYQNRRNAEAKANIRVLEIQPAKTADGKPELTLAQIQKWAPQVQTADITVMTTAEFIGKVETLNDKYDLIYIGTNKAHMNVASGYDYTVFNDSSMNGLIYFATGDMRYSSMELSGQLDTDYVDGNRANNVYYYIPVRYNGNDISKEKMNALNSFLDGSYPVIVSDEFIEKPATVYQDGEYKGYQVSLEVGEYRLADLEARGVRNDDITAIKVKDGYRVICYWDNDFNSATEVVEEDIPYLNWRTNEENGDWWNDRISALKVEKIPDANPKKTIDEDHIDNSSYMYQFAKTALDDNRTNFYAFSEIEDDSELFQFYLNRPKAKLTNTSANGTRREGDQVYYIQDVNGRYNLEYHFTILNEGAASANTQYQCKFYIDVNADGKFSAQEALGDIQLSAGGNSVAYNQLYAGQEYVLKRAVPDGYKGVLPWKVEISQVNNPNIYCFMDGYTKLEGLEKETISILQICRDQVTSKDWWGHKSERLYSLAEQINGKRTVYLDDGSAYSVDNEYVDGYENFLYHTLVYGGNFGESSYEGISDDFEIDVDFMTISYYEREYNKGNIDMSDYNMLILGFSDAYGDFNTAEGQNAPLMAIVDFINSGKSVLLAHDTTSYFNYTDGKRGVTNRKTGATAVNDQYHNASSLNFYIRSLVGMDRYGVMEMAVLKTGVGLTSGTADWNAVAASGKDMAYIPKSNKTKTSPLTQAYTYHIINGKDKHLDTNVSAVDYSVEETGLTDVWRNSYLNLKYDTVYYFDTNDPKAVGYHDQGEIPINYNGETTNLIVTQVNKGQITEYPYKLAEQFQVSTTHGQYYQLDFTADDDKDGQSDLVVWYCMGGRKNASGQYQETIYSQSPNDVVNNYYIYNKGNITYTGMGHAAGRIATDANPNPQYTLDNCTVEEAKLFINTMIAAYSAGVKPPSITIQEDESVDAPEQTVLYRYYDDEFALDTVEQASDPDEEVYFTVQDVNFVKGTRNLAVRVFYSDTSGDQTIMVDGVAKKVRELNRNGTIFNATNNQVADPNNLQSGGIYYIKIPKSILANCDGGLNLYFEAQSVITSNSSTYYTDKIYATLEVMKTYLFDLN